MARPQFAPDPPADGTPTGGTARPQFDPPKPPPESWGSYLGGAAEAAGKGALKSVASVAFPQSPFANDPNAGGLTGSMQSWEKPIADWAASSDKEHPVAEEVGSMIPAALAGAGIERAGMGALRAGFKAIPLSTWQAIESKIGRDATMKVAHAIGSSGVGGFAAKTAAGAAGGALANPNDRLQGAETGAVVGAVPTGAKLAGKAAWGMVPSEVKPYAAKALGGAAFALPYLAYEQAKNMVGGGRWHPGEWSISHAAAPALGGLAALAMKYPGLSGYLAEQARRQLETQGGNQSQSQTGERPDR